MKTQKLVNKLQQLENDCYKFLNELLHPADIADTLTFDYPSYYKNEDEDENKSEQFSDLPKCSYIDKYWNYFDYQILSVWKDEKGILMINCWDNENGREVVSLPLQQNITLEELVHLCTVLESVNKVNSH